MKPTPEFNEEIARAEVLDYFRRSAKWLKEKGYADLNARDKKYFEQCVKDKRKYWPQVWTENQLRKGRQLLEELISKLSKDDQELINDYLEDKLDEARAQEHRHNDPDY